MDIEFSSVSDNVTGHSISDWLRGLKLYLRTPNTVLYQHVSRTFPIPLLVADCCVLCVGWLDTVVMSFLFRLVVAVGVVVVTCCLVVAGVEGDVGGATELVLFSAGGATEPAVNEKYKS